jgi:hypothetical protein
MKQYASASAAFPFHSRSLKLHFLPRITPEGRTSTRELKEQNNFVSSTGIVQEHCRCVKKGSDKSATTSSENVFVAP